MIAAAGGVIWRGAPRHIEVVIVHRPHRRDWTFPKGKLESGEMPLSAALREVREETGFVCDPGPELDSTCYRDRKGRRKSVRYWAMTQVDGSFEPNDEVDELRWIAIVSARQLLSYERDLAVVAGLVPVLSRAH